MQPHKSEITPAIETLILTFASADLDEVYDVLVVEQLQDLDLPQSCDGELKRCSHNRGNKSLLRSKVRLCEA